MSLMFFLPDTFRCQHHSAGESPAGRLHSVAQSGLPGAGRIRGVRLPQRQDLPLTCRDQLHLPGHEQHLPLELTWVQRWLMGNTFNICSGAAEIENPPLVHFWRRVELTTAEMELELWAEFRSVQKHLSPPPVTVCWTSGPIVFEEWQSEQLSEIRNITTGTFPLPYIRVRGHTLYFSTLGSL